MSPRKTDSRKPDAFRVPPDQLRWTCDPKRFGFKSTSELKAEPIEIIGQSRARDALRLGLSLRSEGYNIFVAGEVGSGRSTVTRRLLAEVDRGDMRPDDLVFVHNFADNDQPLQFVFPAGRGCKFRQVFDELIDSLADDLPNLFDAEEYRSHRTALLEATAKEQKNRLRDFEARVQQHGFALVQVQMGPVTRPHLTPVVAGNSVEMDALEALVEQGQFAPEEFEALQERLTQLRTEMESLGKAFRRLDREVRRRLAELERELARPLIDEALQEVRAAFKAEGLAEWLEQVADDVLDNLEEIREAHESSGHDDEHPEVTDPREWARYEVNVLVDNSRTTGRPVIWETAPSFRNLFGTIERTRMPDGEWTSDHTRIRAGSLLKANSGYLVLDAMDVLVEPGVWAALKRTLRNGSAEIQSYDPIYMITAASLKPQPVPIDVTVVMVGTRHIYRLLYGHDEDFKKIFKIKAELADTTPLSDVELDNYARFVFKKVHDDKLPHFSREAVAAVAEHSVRLAGQRDKLTTQFNHIADLIRESGYWARRKRAKLCTARHVDLALERHLHRFNLLEEVLRERAAQGMVLLDLSGEAVGQVNGLAVLDQGDHAFGMPSRITATTAMGRLGIIDLDREAELSGSTHTKGVLVLTGFLRDTFAQDKPLSLTATLSFEQNYGGVDGDSASSTELYAMLSSLSGVPVRQGIAVTGSVNQKGEIQPIGGVNEKIEGFFHLCRMQGLNGKQGVMIPARNLSQIQLHKDIVAAVGKKRFHIWSVETVAEGLEVLTGRIAGTRGKDGRFPAGSIFALADERLTRLAEGVGAYGPADS